MPLDLEASVGLAPGYGAFRLPPGVNGEAILHLWIPIGQVGALEMVQAVSLFWPAVTSGKR